MKAMILPVPTLMVSHIVRIVNEFTTRDIIEPLLQKKTYTWRVF